MSIKAYSPIRSSAVKEVALRAELQKMDEFLRSLSAFTARVPSNPQGTPNVLIANDHGALSGLVPVGLDMNDDHTQYAFLFGRTGGQVWIGDPKTTNAGTDVGVTLRSFNGDPTVIATGPAQFSLLDMEATLTCNNFNIYAQGQSTGLSFATGSGFINIFQNGGCELKGTLAGNTPLLVRHFSHGSANSTMIVRRGTAGAGQTGEMTRWEDELAARMSYIRPSDGAFVGPIVASGTDSHPDNIFKIIGSADATKIVMFEVDGLTTATTRTLTVPDVSGVLLLDTGPATGQKIGTVLPTGGTATDLAINGRLSIGDATAFTTERLLDLSDQTITTLSGSVTLLNVSGLITATGVAAGNYTGLNINVSDINNVFTSGSYNLIGQNVSLTSAVPTGVTIGSASGFNTTLQMSGAGNVTLAVGGIVSVSGGAAAGPTYTAITGLSVRVNHRTSPTTTSRGIEITSSAGASSGACTDAVGIDFLTAFENNAAVVTWHGIRHAAGPTTAIANKWFLDLTSSASSLGNRILYKTAIGWNPATVSAVTAMVHLGAGTTVLAPLQLTTGTSLTTPLAGVIEFTTDDFFATISTGPARKAFVLDDGTRLTSGRVPFATTNGRLIDQTGFTFAASLLSLPGDLTVGTAGTTVTATIGQGTTGTDNATIKVQSGDSGTTAPTISLFRNTTERSRWYFDGTNTRFLATGTFHIQDMVSGDTRAKFGPGTITVGINGVGGFDTFGQGTTGTDNRAIRILSGDSGTTAASLILSRNVTDLARFTVDGTNVYLDFTGALKFRGSIGGTVAATFSTLGFLRLGDTAAPSHVLEVIAGTSTVAPFKLTAGTNLTTAIAGCVEYDGTNYYMSPTALQQRVALMPAVRALASFRA